MYSPIFVVISIIVSMLTFVESKGIENGLSVNDSNGNPMANNNNNSLTNAENIVSRETINHVRHQHHQQIGNLQIITEIDIKNLVSILNTSATAMPNDPKQSGYAILTADATKDSTINMDQTRKQFKRLDRIRDDDYKPFKFPEQPEHSRHVRWPSDHPHPINAFEIVSKSNGMPTHKLLIRFPTSESELENGSSLPENNNKASIFTANDPKLTAIRPLTTATTPSTPTNILNNDPNANANVLDYNNEIWTVNQTAIDNGFEPLVYIDNGVFKVKYVTKGKNSTTIGMDVDLNNSSSINSVKETAIILNDKQLLTKLNTDELTPTNAQVINNTFQSYNGTTATKGTSLIFEKTKDEQNQPQTQSNGRRKPRPFTFDGLPIFV